MSDTPLSRLAKAAEDATDAFAAAVDAHSEAEAAYLKRFHAAFACGDDTASDARRRSEAEQQSFEQKIQMKRAEHSVERCKAVLRTRLAVLSAAQSHMRAVEKQT